MTGVNLARIDQLLSDYNNRRITYDGKMQRAIRDEDIDVSELLDGRFNLRFMIMDYNDANLKRCRTILHIDSESQFINAVQTVNPCYSPAKIIINNIGDIYILDKDKKHINDFILHYYYNLVPDIGFMFDSIKDRLPDAHIKIRAKLLKEDYGYKGEKEERKILAEAFKNFDPDLR